MDLIMHGWEPTPVGDYAEASRIHSERRDASGLGASSFPDGHIATPAGVRIARISYNGRVWPPGRWREGDEPLWDNRDPGARPATFPAELGGRTLPMERHDRLSDLPHKISRARKAIRELGLHATHDDAAVIAARAYGRRDETRHRTAIARGETLRWSHHAAAAAVAERLAVAPPDARRAADAAAHVFETGMVTLGDVRAMVGAAPAMAATPLPLDALDATRRGHVERAGAATVGDLAAQGDRLGADALDAALDALRTGREEAEC